MSSNPGQTLTLWHAWQREERQMLDQWRAAYTRHNPTVRVEAMFVPLNDLGTYFVESATAGAGPDLVIGPPEWLARWSLEGLIRPLDDVLPETLRARVSPVAWEAVTFNGTTYAVPLVIATLALYYNRDLLPAPPTTFDAMLQAAGEGGLLFNMSLQWTVGYLHALGGALMDAQGDPTVNDAAGQAWLARLADVCAADGVTVAYDHARFVQGEAAMIIDGSWNLDAYRVALGDRLCVAPLPALEGAPAAPWVRTENAYVSAAIGGARPAAVMDFLTYALTAEALAASPTRAGQLPAVLDAVPEDSPVGVFAAQAAGGVPFPNRPELEAYWAPMQNAIRAVTEQGADPAAALASASDEIAARVAEVRANLPVTVYPSFAPAAPVRRATMIDEPLFPFVLQDELVFEPQQAHPDLGCGWQGIAGEMRSMDGEPLTRIIMVHVRGSGLNAFVVAGTAPDYGAGGWEVCVGDTAAADTYHVTLMHTNGELLSETFRVRFPGDCQGNLARLDFVQVRPL